MSHGQNPSPGGPTKGSHDERRSRMKAMPSSSKPSLLSSSLHSKSTPSPTKAARIVPSPPIPTSTSALSTPSISVPSSSPSMLDRKLERLRHRMSQFNKKNRDKKNESGDNNRDQSTTNRDSASTAFSSFSPPSSVPPLLPFSPVILCQAPPTIGATLPSITPRDHRHQGHDDDDINHKITENASSKSGGPCVNRRDYTAGSGEFGRSPGCDADAIVVNGCGSGIEGTSDTGGDASSIASDYVGDCVRVRGKKDGPVGNEIVGRAMTSSLACQKASPPSNQTIMRSCTGGSGSGYGKSGVRGDLGGYDVGRKHVGCSGGTSRYKLGEGERVVGLQCGESDFVYGSVDCRIEDDQKHSSSPAVASTLSSSTPSSSIQSFSIQSLAPRSSSVLPSPNPSSSSCRSMHKDGEGKSALRLSSGRNNRIGTIDTDDINSNAARVNIGDFGGVVGGNGDDTILARSGGNDVVCGARKKRKMAMNEESEKVDEEDNISPISAPSPISPLHVADSPSVGRRGSTSDSEEGDYDHELQCHEAGHWHEKKERLADDKSSISLSDRRGKRIADRDEIKKVSSFLMKKRKKDTGMEVSSDNIDSGDLDTGDVIDDTDEKYKERTKQHCQNDGRHSDTDRNLKERSERIGSEIKISHNDDGIAMNQNRRKAIPNNTIKKNGTRNIRGNESLSCDKDVDCSSDALTWDSGEDANDIGSDSEEEGQIASEKRGRKKSSATISGHLSSSKSSSSLPLSTSVSYSSSAKSSSKIMGNSETDRKVKNHENSQRNYGALGSDGNKDLHNNDPDYLLTPDDLLTPEHQHQNEAGSIDQCDIYSEESFHKSTGEVTGSRSEFPSSSTSSSCNAVVLKSGEMISSKLRAKDHVKSICDSDESHGGDNKNSGEGEADMGASRFNCGDHGGNVGSKEMRGENSFGGWKRGKREASVSVGNDDSDVDLRDNTHTADKTKKKKTSEITGTNKMESGDNSNKSDDDNQAKNKCAAADCLQNRPHNALLNGCRRVDIFKKLNKISEGTYGAVFRAENKTTKEIVALKKIKYYDKLWNEGFPITSLREISIMLELKDENVLDVKEIVIGGAGDDFLSETSNNASDNPNLNFDVYMVMEYIEHELKQLIDDDKPQFSISEKKCLLFQLIKAVKYMHENWVVHRDLKTSNLLYSNSGVLKVCDFGMSRKFGDPIKQYTSNVVTLWYRAPEILLGQKKYNEACDVWSVGCIFGELLLRRPLFMGHGEGDTLSKMFKLIGSPKDDDWQFFSDLANVKNQKFWSKPPFYAPSWRETFPSPSSVYAPGSVSGGGICAVGDSGISESSILSDAGLDLMQRLLQFNPSKRITAAEALNHDYFHSEKPRPQLKALMPTVPDTNNQARRKKNRHKILGRDGRRQQEVFHGATYRFGGRVDAEKFLLALNDQRRESRKQNQEGRLTRHPSAGGRITSSGLTSHRTALG